MINTFDYLIAKRYLLSKSRDRFFSMITVFSFLGISLGVATLIIVMSVMNGFREELTSKVLGINGHMKIKAFNNSEIKNYDSIFSDQSFIHKKILQHPTLNSQGLITFKNHSTGIIIKGIRVEDLKQRNLLNKSITKEAFIDFENNKGIIIGKRLKERFQIKTNDFVKVISSKSLDTPFGKLVRSSDFRVLGFFETGMYEYDLNLILIPLPLLQNFLEVGNKVDTVEIFIDDFKEIDEVYDLLNLSLPDYFNLIDWRNLNPSLFNAIEVERNVMFLILLLIIVVAAFNLISSMIMLVNNKRRDIGILRTLGVTKYQLIKIFIMNGFIIGFIGTILGLILGMLFCFNINEIKSFIEIFMDSELFSQEIYFFANLPVIIDYDEVITIVTISLLLSFLATIYPSYKASEIEPIHLIKME